MRLPKKGEVFPKRFNIWKCVPKGFEGRPRVLRKDMTLKFSTGVDTSVFEFSYLRYSVEFTPYVPIRIFWGFFFKKTVKRCREWKNMVRFSTASLINHSKLCYRKKITVPPLEMGLHSYRNSEGYLLSQNIV